MRRYAALYLILGILVGIGLQYYVDAGFVKKEFHSKRWSLFYNVDKAAKINEEAVKLFK